MRWAWTNQPGAWKENSLNLQPSCSQSSRASDASVIVSCVYPLMLNAHSSVTFIQCSLTAICAFLTAMSCPCFSGSLSPADRVLTWGSAGRRWWMITSDVQTSLYKVFTSFKHINIIKHFIRKRNASYRNTSICFLLLLFRLLWNMMEHPADRVDAPSAGMSLCFIPAVSPTPHIKAPMDLKPGHSSCEESEENMFVSMMPASRFLFNYFLTLWY